MASKKIFCKSDTNLCLAIHDDKVVVAAADTYDSSQFWIKGYINVGRLVDEHGHKPFILRNASTKLVLANKDAPRPPEMNWGTPLQLVHLGEGDNVKTTMLWTESDDIGNGFHEIRAFRNPTLTMWVHYNGTRQPATNGAQVVLCPGDTSYPTAVWKESRS